MAIKASSDNKFVFSGSEEGTVKAFSLETYQQVQFFEGIHQGKIMKRKNNI